MKPAARHLLGIDAGGTVVKAALFTADGTLVAAHREMLPVLAPDSARRERDPEALWLAARHTIAAVMKAADIGGEHIAGIGITGYGNGVYLVDDQGRAVMNGVLSSDKRAEPIVEQWRADGLEDKHRALTYQNLWPAKPLSLIAWLAQHRPEVLARASTALSCKDFLRLRLTGRCATDVTDAATASLIAGPGRGDFESCFRLLGQEQHLRLMPRIAESTEWAGRVTAEAALATGLNEGTPVTIGLSDNAAMNLGSGAFHLGEMTLIAGTWGLHDMRIEAPVNDGSVMACCQGAVPGQWLAIEGSPSSASIFEWWLSATRAPASDQAVPQDGALYAQANAAVQALDRPGEDLAAPLLFMPHLNGSIDDTQARGSFLGLSADHGFGHLVRAVYEGIAFEHKLHSERLFRLTGKPQRVRFSGGATNSAVWTQLFADVLDLPLEIPQGQEIGALGTAMTVAVALGWQPDLETAAAAMTRARSTVHPRPAAQPALQARLEAWREAREKLHGLWRGPAFTRLSRPGR